MPSPGEWSVTQEISSMCCMERIFPAVYISGVGVPCAALAPLTKSCVDVNFRHGNIKLVIIQPVIQEVQLQGILRVRLLA